MTVNEQPPVTIKEQVITMIEWLASFGRTNNGGVTRLLYSPSWLSAQQALKEKMNESGLHAYFDDAGNLFGRLEGTEKNAPAILTGSHIDTVVDGGKYDGAYGIIASLLAVRYLSAYYGMPKKPIEVVSLCEEEGSRFPLTFWGSGSITGKYTYEDIKELKDADGASFIEEMKRSDFGKGKYCEPKRNDIGTFIELHIEQGAVLERDGLSLGVVSCIAGQRRYTVQITGESNHAGTTPMVVRKDALVLASEFISYVAGEAKKVDETLVATVGKMEIKPNVPNVIPGEVLFTLDVRHPREEVIEQFCEMVFQYFQSTSSYHKMKLSISEWMNVRPVMMDEKLTELSTNIVRCANIPFKKMVSGAGHDAQVFGGFCPTALLFVPSRQGISHSPEEYTAEGDLANGINILIKLLYELAYK